jgi:hypothetical protein
MEEMRRVAASMMVSLPCGPLGYFYILCIHFFIIDEMKVGATMMVYQPDRPTGYFAPLFGFLQCK